MVDTNNAGAERQSPNPADEAAKSGGTYKDPVDSIPMADRFHEKEFPQAPDPQPFTKRG